MAWIGVITNAGAALLAEWTAGEHTLTIDGATVGSGYYPEVNMRVATALSSEKDDAAVVSAEEVTGGTQFRIRVSAINGTSYTAHEIGIWGHIDNEDPVLIAYHQDSVTGVVVPTAASMPGFFFDLYCVHAIGNEGELTITLSDTSFATRDELAETEEEIENMIAPIEETSSASQDYDTDKLLIYDGKLYRALSDIQEEDTLTPNTNITETKVAYELSTLQALVASIIQLSAFSIEEEDDEMVLYWYGADGVCPYTLALEDGAYVLYFTYTTV